MTYLEWYETHAGKHRAIVEKLVAQGYDEQAIIDYFEFENMVENEPQFCLLYETKTKCHDMERLNCYLCACPYFRFSDAGIKRMGEDTLYSRCSIDAAEGTTMTWEHAIHQDCSNCHIPHKQPFIKKVFDRDWRTIMKACELSSD
jgi:Zn-finger protein